MNDMTATLAELDRLHAEAMPGIWEVHGIVWHIEVLTMTSHRAPVEPIARFHSINADGPSGAPQFNMAHANAELVTALVNAYPALRARIAELEEAAAGDAKVAAEAVQRIAELERKAAAVDGFLAAIQKPFTEDDLKQIEEARLVERKSKAFDAIAQAWVENRFSLTIGADNDDGFVDIDSLEPTDNPETLLTAIEAATAAKETPNG